MSRPWQRQHHLVIVTTDVVLAIGAVLIAHRLLVDSRWAPLNGPGSPPYALLSVGLVVLWLTLLAWVRSRDRRVLGYGPAEYARVLGASARLFGVVALASYLFDWEVGRAYLLVTVPMGAGMLVGGRHLVRRWLHRRRARGMDKSTVIVVSPLDKVATLIDEFHGEPSSEFQVVGICVPSVDPDLDTSLNVRGVPVLGGIADVAAVAGALSVSTVAVDSADEITSDTVRRLGWDLEGLGVDVALATTLIDVGGPRVTLRPMNTLPLLYVDEPRFSGPKYVTKSVLDWVVALLITILISPLLIGLAIAVKATSPGPAFFVQRRIGRNGRPFSIVKFRSMVVGAEDQLTAVLESEGITSAGLLFKARSDPRVTRFGRFIRRYSLDELPQLFNVLRGEMSLVGPRPPLPTEVELYDRAAHRRLLVKPGMTGLWQVSGRSDLPVEQAIRLDLRYAENWSMSGDLSILVRTVKVMLTGIGAR
jgi:exopolysaccharide biosynthesis polyprenyl glycosylphosphotransferase